MELNRTIFVSVDIETTGLGKNAKIVEIGAYKFKPFGLGIEMFDELIHPGIEIPQDVISIHGITDEMVEHKPEIEKVMPMFLDFIAGHALIAHNARFDFSFLSRTALLCGVEIQDSHVFDTLAISRKAFPGIKHNLIQLSNFLGLKPDGDRHRGLSDAKLAAGVFELCMDKLNINTYAKLRKRFRPRYPMSFLGKQ